jgi:hypothetical protein
MAKSSCVRSQATVGRAKRFESLESSCPSVTKPPTGTVLILTPKNEATPISTLTHSSSLEIRPGVRMQSPQKMTGVASIGLR